MQHICSCVWRHLSIHDAGNLLTSAFLILYVPYPCEISQISMTNLPHLKYFRHLTHLRFSFALNLTASFPPLSAGIMMARDQPKGCSELFRTQLLEEGGATYYPLMRYAQRMYAKYVSLLVQVHQQTHCHACTLPSTHTAKHARCRACKLQLL